LHGQSELREYIQAVLEAEALPAANHLFVIPSFCPSPHDAPTRCPKKAVDAGKVW
jgi:hypothetical protein